MTLSLDTDAVEQRYRLEPATGRTPEEIFMRRWALTVLGRALARLREESTSDDQRRRFEALKPYLTGEEPEKPYWVVGEALGMTETAVRQAAHRLRRRFGQVLRDEIAETVADEDAIDDEVRQLLTTIGPWDSG